MDRRKTLWAALGLLAALAGCQHDIRMNATAPTPQAQTVAPPPQAAVQTVPPNAVVRQEADLPRKTPHASTCVAGGDFFAQQALAPEIGETARIANQEKARKAYQQALSIDPRCLPAYESLAALYVAMKDHTHAVATYQKAAQVFPKEARVFYELGMCHGGEKEWDLAVRNLAHAATLDPENRKFVDALGWMQARAGRYDDSLATFMKVHDEPEAHYKLACMLEHLNQIDLCKQHLQAALDKNPQMDKAQRCWPNSTPRRSPRCNRLPTRSRPIPRRPRRRRRTTRRRPRMASSCRRRRASPSAMRAPRPCRNPATRRPLRGMRPTKTHHSGERGASAP